MILTLKPIRRHFVTGLSKGPQGADGVATLARDAYLAMLAAPWADDTREAMLPVHEYKREPPAGQAYKCVWGYDAAARTEWSACGAECYTYKIPADALDATNADGVADIASVTVRLAGDRYLDRGCSLWCEISASAEPSPVAVALAAGDGVARLATQNQVDAEGSALAPNRRAGMEDSISVGMDGAAPAPYLHVHLFLADYLSVRGSWIEGGAMFAETGADIEFSREVSVADADAEGDSCALDVGRVSVGTSSNQVAAAYAVQHLPRASIWENFSIMADNSTNGALQALSSDFGQRVRDLLAFILSPPALWTSSETGKLAAATTVGYAGAGALSVSSSAIGFCCLCAHGLTEGRVFRGLRFASALPDAIPYRLLVYGISADIDVADAGSGSSLRFSTPLAYWADILSRTFRQGKATSLRIMADPTLAAQSMSAATADKTESVAVQPLAARDVSGTVSRVDFDAPFRSGELSSVIVALVPNGAPSGTLEQTEQYNATATRSVTAAIPVQATRQALTASVSPSGTASFRIASTIKAAVQGCYSGIQARKVGDEYAWSDATMANMSDTYAKTNYSTAVLAGLNLSFARGGKTYVYNTANGDAVPSFSFKVDFMLFKRPFNTTTWGPMQFLYAGSPVGSFSFVAHAADGSTLPVTAVFDGGSVIRFRNNGGASDLRGDIDAGVDLVFSQYQGYFSPKDWYDQTSAVTGNAQNYDDTDASMVDSARATLSGHVYSFASAANETAVSTVTQSGTVTFQKDGVAYTASYAKTDTPKLGVGNKTTGTRVIVGNDTTETATAFGNVSAISQRLKFTGSDGSVLWAQVSLPASQIKGDVAYQAKTAYNGSSQGVGTVYNDGAATGSGAAYRVGLQGTATVTEAYASATVNPGLITLYE